MKQKQDARVFARRVKMSKKDLFVLVEGKSHDRPFYERLLRKLPSTADLNVNFRLVEQIAVDGKAAGGKSHGLEIYKKLKEVNGLVQHNSTGRHQIIFMLDRDLDDLTSTQVLDASIVYTQFADVEAEILNHGDVLRGLTSSMGITKSQLRPVKTALTSPLASLAHLWREWLTLGLIAATCAPSYTGRMRIPSQVNVGQYGAVDPKAVARLSADINKLHDPDGLLRLRINSLVDAAWSSGDIVLRVKGKWVSSYCLHLAREAVQADPVRSPIHSDWLVSATLETIKFGADWNKYFNRQLHRAITSN